MQRLPLPSGRPVCEHRVENHQELAHAGGKRHFLGFAGPTARLIASANDGIETSEDNSIHVQDGSRVSSITHTVRLPRDLPLSRCSGATPISAATCLWNRKGSGAFSSYGAVSGPISRRVAGWRHRHLPVSDRFPLPFTRYSSPLPVNPQRPLPYSYEPTLSALG